MKSLKIFLAFYLLAFAALANNQAPASPYQVLETVGTDLFSRISANQQELEKFPHLMEEIVEEELMPYVDYQYASYRILGKHLKKTTKEQRNQFVNSMRKYLVRTYAKTLQQYNNQEVIFEPEKSTGSKRIVSVSTKIVETGKPDIKLIFQMRQHKKTKEWKAFDMIVEGISLLSSKQSEISSRINQIGVEQVSLELAYVNK